MECKLETACNDLDLFLSTLSQQNIPSPEVLQASPISTLVSSNTDEAYRCKCSFQIIAGDNDNLSCVVRENGLICRLPGGIFLPANHRIRKAMNCLIKLLNKRNEVSEGYSIQTKHKFHRLRENLTSVTFGTSWDEAECLVTLHYGPPGLQSCDEWKQEAQMVCKECQFSLVNGRSKGKKICATHIAATDDSILEEGIIQDTLWLALEKMPIAVRNMRRLKNVSLVQPKQSTATLNVRIQYQKPATAFQHPNAGVMLTSLQWILTTLSNVSEKHITTRMSDARRMKPRLLEMYCGCGAHTIPLAKSMLISEIVAVELDERLVNACINNCRLNNCFKDHAKSDDDVEKDQDQTLVNVFRGDAAEWAAKTLRCIHKKNGDKHAKQISNGKNSYNEFDILLVDPPRQGLDTTVCEMAMKGTFSHVIYISCGRRSLLRDLKLLCTAFDIEDLAIIDLFPGTDAVETLLHLKRKTF